MRRCTAKTKTGKPCRMPPVGGTKPPRCFQHAGGKIAKRRAAALRLGGQHRMRQVDRAALGLPTLTLRSREEGADALVRVAQEVMAGKLDPRSANSIIAAVQGLIDRELLGVGGGGVLDFAAFKEITVTTDEDLDVREPRPIGELPDGSRVAFSHAMADRWRRWLKQQAAAKKDVAVEVLEIAESPSDEAPATPTAPEAAPLPVTPVRVA